MFHTSMQLLSLPSVNNAANKKIGIYYNNIIWSYFDIENI